MSTQAEENGNHAGQARKRLRWNGERWQDAEPALVVHSRKFRSPEDVARDVSEMIVRHRLVDVMFIGETVDHYSKAYVWMLPSRQLWYCEQLRFYAMHGRFPHQDARGGGPV